MRDREGKREKFSGSQRKYFCPFKLERRKETEKKQEVTIFPQKRRDFLNYFPLHKERRELVHSSAPGVGSSGRKRDSSPAQGTEKPHPVNAYQDDAQQCPKISVKTQERKCWHREQ